MALDIEQPDQLIAYLTSTGRIGTAETPIIAVLGGGVSNRTVLVERGNGECWVLKQALPKLRVQVDWFSPPERVHREADGLRWLQRLAPPGTITPLVFEDFEHHLIAMQAVAKPHQNWKSMLLGGALDLHHVAQFATILGTVHRASGAMLADLQSTFGDRGYFESLRLEPYYGYTATQVPAATEFLTALINETRSHADTLVHGDYSPKNVLVHDGRLVLLDHEVIHIGDPGFDLGFALTHMLSKAHHLPELRRDFGYAAAYFWERYDQIVYREPWADELETRVVRHTLGCLLARVRGRSPLEYLDTEERQRQERAVVQLMGQPPQSVRELADRFVVLVTQKV